MSDLADALSNLFLDLDRYDSGHLTEAGMLRKLSDMVLLLSQRVEKLESRADPVVSAVASHKVGGTE